MNDGPLYPITDPREEIPAPPTELISMLQGCRNPAILVSPDYRILAANEAYERTHGVKVRPGQDRCYAISHHYSSPCDQHGELCPLRSTLEGGQPTRVLHVHHSAQGREHVDVETIPIRGEDGRIKYLMEHMRRLSISAAEPKSELALLGRAPSFLQMLGLLQRVAPTDVPVLLLGESGTGKEVVARAIHQSSLRGQRPFVPVECSGLAEGLFESELFGHERGAFTGAHSEKVGLVEAAEGGTLFLDEIGDVPLSLQVKLLRLLESASYRRVGGVETRRADFRLMCATHRDLKGMVTRGEFRQDLYYRISAFPIHLPSLRERLTDLPLLVEAQLQQLGSKKKLSPEALDRLRRHSFPGNVRELRNLLQRATLLSDGADIELEHLPSDLDEHAPTPLEPEGLPRHPLTRPEVMTLDELERRYLEWITDHHAGDRRSLAEALGVSERTLFRKLKRRG